MSNFDGSTHKRKPLFSWYKGWTVIGVGIMCQAITMGLIVHCFTFWIVPFQEEFGALKGAVLLAATLSNIFMGLYSPFAGRLMDNYSTRALTIIGILLFSSGFFLVSVTTALWQVALIYCTFLPLSVILAGPLGAQVAASRWFDKKRGLALGVSSIGIALGGFILPPIVTMLISTHGWRETNMILAVTVLAVMLPVVWFFIREPKVDDKEPGVETKDDIHLANDAVSLPRLMTTKQILSHPVTWIMICAIIPFMTVVGSLQYHMAPIAAEAGVSVQSASFIMSAFAGSMLVGGLVFGALADRFRHHLVLHFAVVLVALGALALLLGKSYAALIVGYAFLVLV